MAAPYRSAFDELDSSYAELISGALLQKYGARWDSEEAKEWWSELEARSSIASFCPDWEAWRLLMKILTQFDVSRIENLWLGLPNCSLGEPKTIPQKFGDVVLAVGSRFSALKTLRLSFDGKRSGRYLGSDSLAKALRSGVLRNLHSLFFESKPSPFFEFSPSPCPCPPEILEAVLEGDLPQLTAIRFSTKSLPLCVAFESPRFSKMRGLSLLDVDFFAWHSFTAAVQSGDLSNIRDFEMVYCNAELDNMDGRNMDDIAKWFSSLKYFFCSLGSSTLNLSLLLSALRKAPLTELAWESLRFRGRYLRQHSMVEELEGLADSGRLPHFDTLDLSLTGLPSKSLLTLIQSIGRGSLPNLQRLVWTRNKVDDETVEAIVEAYYANTSLTTHVDIDWDKVRDPSLGRKLETYRDRNEKLVKLVVEKKRLEQRIGEEEIDGANTSLTTHIDIDWEKVRIPSLGRKLETYRDRDEKLVKLVVEKKGLEQRIGEEEIGGANTSLTTHIDIDWEKVRDPSLGRKLETYRDRDEKLVKLVVEKKRLEQRIGEEEIDGANTSLTTHIDIDWEKVRIPSLGRKLETYRDRDEKLVKLVVEKKRLEQRIGEEEIGGANTSLTTHIDIDWEKVRIPSLGRKLETYRDRDEKLVKLVVEKKRLEQRIGEEEIDGANTSLTTHIDIDWEKVRIPSLGRKLETYRDRDEKLVKLVVEKKRLEQRIGEEEIGGANTSLTTHVDIDWEKVRDPSLGRKLETYTDRNEKLVKLVVEKKRLEQRIGEEKIDGANTSLTTHIDIDWEKVRIPSLGRKLETYRDRDEKLVKLVVEKKRLEQRIGEEEIGGANTSLTTHIDIDWEKVRDPSLGRKLETYRDRNEKLVKLVVEKKRLEQRIGEEEIDGANTSLTTHIDIDWEKVRIPSLGRKLETYRDRDEKLVKLVVEKKRLEQRIGEEEIGGGKQVQDLQDLVPLTSARVFICGYPEVGKTTLRKTLLRQFEQSREVETCAEVRKNQRFVEWCCCLGTTTLANKEHASPNEERSLPNEWPTRLNERTKASNEEPRTRGIEVSRIEDCSNGESTTLVLWDLAGQQEYHILHSAFLADRGPISGKSTTFILVFRAAYKQSVKGELLYWLRMLASGSPPGVKRPVMIVLNRFEGERFKEEIDGKRWMGDVKSLNKLFVELDVCLKLFYIDVREAVDVQQLRNHLFDTARNLLKNCRVPRVFLNLQMKLKGWSEKEECLPIYTWEAFKNTWDLEPAETVKDLERSASILHEIGEIIYLNKSIVVPDPEWFCKRIVGELLLPEAIDIREYRFPSDGKISITSFQIFFEDSLVKSTKIDDIISMLQYIGLCYKSGKEHIIVPALICDDDYSTIGWNGQGDEFMGRSLTTADQVHSNADQEQKNQEGQESKCAEGRKYIIPAALFRHLQVKLADHEDFGLRGDANYTVGKSFLSCTVGRLFVLVQFDVDPSDPTVNRIDILVKIKQDSSNMKDNPVECICQIMEIVERLCIAVCPGLKYQIKCIEPLSASNSIQDMSGRKLMSLNEIKERIVKGEECLSWRTVGGDFVKPETCLSESELKAVVDAVKGRYVACQNDQQAMRVFATKAAGDDASRSNESARDKILAPGSNDQEQLLRNQTDEIVDRIVRHFDKKMEELKSVLLDFRQKHDRLVKEIQAQRALFIADKVRGVPRYIFLSKRETGPWMSVTEAFRKSYRLHFLCEARFEKNGDRRFMHEVEKQEGIELKNPQEWLVKAKPWLLWSLQVAVMVAKTVGNVYLPGIFSLIPDIDFLDSDKLAKAVDTAAAQILEEGRDANQVQVHDRGYGNASQPVNLEENVIAESVVADLKHELCGTDFAKKTKLSRMMFREAYGSTSNQSQSPIVWICKDCIKKYGSKVVPFR